MFSLKSDKGYAITTALSTIALVALFFISANAVVKLTENSRISETGTGVITHQSINEDDDCKMVGDVCYAKHKTNNLGTAFVAQAIKFPTVDSSRQLATPTLITADFDQQLAHCEAYPEETDEEKKAKYMCFVILAQKEVLAERPDNYKKIHDACRECLWDGGREKYNEMKFIYGAAIALYLENFSNFSSRTAYTIEVTYFDRNLLLDIANNPDVPCSITQNLIKILDKMIATIIESIETLEDYAEKNIHDADIRSKLENVKNMWKGSGSFESYELYETKEENTYIRNTYLRLINHVLSKETVIGMMKPALLNRKSVIEILNERARTNTCNEELVQQISGEQIENIACKSPDVSTYSSLTDRCCTSAGQEKKVIDGEKKEVWKKDYEWCKKALLLEELKLNQLEDKLNDYGPQYSCYIKDDYNAHKQECDNLCNTIPSLEWCDLEDESEYKLNDYGAGYSCYTKDDYNAHKQECDDLCNTIPSLEWCDKKQPPTSKTDITSPTGGVKEVCTNSWDTFCLDQEGDGIETGIKRVGGYNEKEEKETETMYGDLREFFAERDDSRRSTVELIAQKEKRAKELEKIIKDNGWFTWTCGLGCGDEEEELAKLKKDIGALKDIEYEAYAARDDSETKTVELIAQKEKDAKELSKKIEDNGLFSWTCGLGCGDEEEELAKLKKDIGALKNVEDETSTTGDDSKKDTPTPGEPVKEPDAKDGSKIEAPTPEVKTRSIQTLDEPVKELTEQPEDRPFCAPGTLWTNCYQNENECKKENSEGCKKFNTKEMPYCKYGITGFFCYESERECIEDFGASSGCRKFREVETSQETKDATNTGVADAGDDSKKETPASEVTPPATQTLDEPVKELDEGVYVSHKGPLATSIPQDRPVCAQIPFALRCFTDEESCNAKFSKCERYQEKIDAANKDEYDANGEYTIKEKPYCGGVLFRDNCYSTLDHCNAKYNNCKEETQFKDVTNDHFCSIGVFWGTNCYENENLCKEKSYTKCIKFDSPEALFCSAGEEYCYRNEESCLKDYTDCKRFGRDTQKTDTTPKADTGNTLTAEEKAKKKAEADAEKRVADAKKAEAEKKAKAQLAEQKRLAEEARKKAEEEARKKAEADAEKRVTDAKKAEEEAKKKAEAEKKAQAQLAEQKRLAEEARKKAQALQAQLAEQERQRKLREQAMLAKLAEIDKMNEEAKKKALAEQKANAAKQQAAQKKLDQTIDAQSNQKKIYEPKCAIVASETQSKVGTPVEIKWITTPKIAIATSKINIKHNNVSYGTQDDEVSNSGSKPITPTKIGTYTATIDVTGYFGKACQDTTQFSVVATSTTPTATTTEATATPIIYTTHTQTTDEQPILISTPDDDFEDYTWYGEQPTQGATSFANIYATPNPIYIGGQALINWRGVGNCTLSGFGIDKSNLLGDNNIYITSTPELERAGSYPYTLRCGNASSNIVVTVLNQPVTYSPSESEDTSGDEDKLFAQVTSQTAKSNTSNNCPIFTQYLELGMVNSHVATAEKFLHRFGYFTGTPDNIFDAETQSAVELFQTAHATAILAPWGHTVPTGYWYKTTRSYANKLMGCTDPTFNPDLGDTL